MTGHEAAVFKESESLRPKRKDEIEVESEKRRKRLDDENIIEKTSRDRHTKQRQEKE